MKPLTIKNNNIQIDIRIKQHDSDTYSYFWIDERPYETVYHSERIQTSSQDVVYFLGLIDCIKRLQEYDVTKFIKCDSSKTQSWFLSGRIDDLNSYPNDVRLKLQDCLDWINNNQVIVKNVIPPWKDILWKIPASTVIV